MMAERKSKSKVRKTSTSSKPAAKSAKTANAKSPSKAKPSTAADRAIGNDAARLINERIRELGDWRGETLARMRGLILEADHDMTEEWKWMGTPVWSHHGNVCTGETYKQVVKLTFARGAFVEDPRGLFNSSLEGNMRRAIDIREGEVLDAKAFKTLIQAAVAENLRFRAPKAKSAPKLDAKAKPLAKANEKETKPTKARQREKGDVVLLTCGNPQIAKADGDAPVRAYIAAMPGWKREIGERLDAIIVGNVPNVQKAVKWNSPFYGIEGQGWFLSFHVFTRYVKVTFFKGTALRPAVPGGTGKDARWIDIHENEKFDETQMTKWVKQAAKLPGWLP